MEDYYAILGVPSNATIELIREAYRKQSSYVHPDLHQDPALKEWAEQRQRELNEAFEVLSDPVKRKEYDALRNEAHNIVNEAGEHAVKSENHYIYALLPVLAFFVLLFVLGRTGLLLISTPSNPAPIEKTNHLSPPRQETSVSQPNTQPESTPDLKPNSQSKPGGFGAVVSSEPGGFGAVAFSDKGAEASSNLRLAREGHGFGAVSYRNMVYGSYRLRVYHSYDCPLLDSVPADDLVCFPSPEDAEKAGFVPCRTCGTRVDG